MSDLISRQAVLSLPRSKERNFFGEVISETINVKMIEALPTIELRAKGEWVYGEHDVAMCDGYRCNHCGFFVPWDYKYAFIDFIKDYHFCPNCGAVMMEEKDGG